MRPVSAKGLISFYFVELGLIFRTESVSASPLWLLNWIPLPFSDRFGFTVMLNWSKNQFSIYYHRISLRCQESRVIRRMLQ